MGKGGGEFGLESLHFVGISLTSQRWDEQMAKRANSKYLVFASEGQFER